MTDQYAAQRALNDTQFSTFQAVLLAGQRWRKRQPGFTASKLHDCPPGTVPVKNGKAQDGFRVIARYV